jgi:peptidase E
MPQKTIYILAGGNDREYIDYAKRLETELNKYITSPKILSCFFASPDSEWNNQYLKWREWFNLNLSHEFSFEYAKKEAFLEQIDASDVVYLHGGITKLLLSNVPDADTLKDYFRGKIVIASSAGANTLARNYWSSTYAEPGHGLGIVDINVMVHYGAINHEGRKRTMNDWQKEEALFSKYVQGEKITYLPEGEFTVIKT